MVEETEEIHQASTLTIFQTRLQGSFHFYFHLAKRDQSLHAPTPPHHPSRLNSSLQLKDYHDPKWYKGDNSCNLNTILQYSSIVAFDVMDSSQLFIRLCY